MLDRCIGVMCITPRTSDSVTRVTTALRSGRAGVHTVRLLSPHRTHRAHRPQPTRIHDPARPPTTPTPASLPPPRHHPPSHTHTPKLPPAAPPHPTPRPLQVPASFMAELVVSEPRVLAFSQDTLRAKFQALVDRREPGGRGGKGGGQKGEGGSPHARPHARPWCSLCLMRPPPHPTRCRATQPHPPYHPPTHPHPPGMDRSRMTSPMWSSSTPRCSSTRPSPRRPPRP